MVFPIYPDFILVLDATKEDLYEAFKLNLPLLGLVDSNINPKFFVFYFLSNNDSIDIFYFFLIYMEEFIYEGFFREQEFFYYKILLNLKLMLFN
jgi:ribosomal protein S2